MEKMRPRRTRITHRGTRRDLDPHGCPIEGQDKASTRTDGSSSDKTRPRRTRMAHRVTRRGLDAHGWLIEGQGETSTRTDGSSRDRTRPQRTRMACRGTGWELNRRGDKKNAPNDPARGGLKRCGSSGDVRLGWGREGSEVLTPKRK